MSIKIAIILQLYPIIPINPKVDSIFVVLAKAQPEPKFWGHYKNVKNCLAN